MTLLRRFLLSAFVLGAVHAGGTELFAQVNPYAPGSFGAPGMTNPYQPGGGGYPGYGYGYPTYGEAGGLLFGQADVMRAYGMAINAQQQARITQQQAVQARLDTQRKRFELEMFIKANTPTFTEAQAKVAQTTLSRIKTNSTPAEIANGKSLNLMLDDVKRFTNRKVSSDSLPLAEEVLLQLNVTSSDVGLGALRNDGRIDWPIGLQEFLSPETRKTLDAQAQALVQGATKGKIDPNTFRDFSNELDRTYDALVKKVNDLGPHYLEAKRFLGDLKDARRALEKGEAQHQVNYMKWVSNGGGKSVQDVADYMLVKGLRFAPGTTYDEAAYRAFFSAFVAYDVALNAQAGPADASSEQPPR